MKVKTIKIQKQNKPIAGIAKHLIVALLTAAAVALCSLAVQAEDEIKNEKAKIDFTNTGATGTVSINIVAKTEKKVKVSIESGSNRYNYDLKGDGTVERYPLQWGNGEYTVRVMIQSVETKYSVALSTKYTLDLKNEKLPFTNSSQLVNYNKDSAIVKKAAELIKGVKKDVEKVEKIYKFVVESLEYDTKKAATVQSGYVPDIDKIVNSGMGICFDYAAVFAAMLRSQGIPAKLVMGYVKVPDSKDPVYHAWNEFYSAEKEGWFKINEMKFVDKDNTFVRADPTFESSSKSAKAVMKWIGDGSNYDKVYEF